MLSGWEQRNADGGFSRKRQLPDGTGLWRREYRDGTVHWRAVRSGQLVGSHISQPKAQGYVGGLVRGDYAAGHQLGFAAWRALMAGPVITPGAPTVSE